MKKKLANNTTCVEYGGEGKQTHGTNIAGFVNVTEAMLAQRVI